MLVISARRLMVAVTACAALARAVPLENRGTPVPPTQDAFYALPEAESLDSASPGTILRHRKVPSPIAAFRLLPENLQAAHQILYRTNNNFGNATATVLTVLVPHHADYRKVISHQSAEDAAFVNCAPSYALQFASDDSGFFGTTETQLELIVMQTFLEQGWIVILPDHEGPNGAFLANRQAGQAVLDGIRAALASKNLTGIENDARVGLWGYSGGSMASSWAAELQPEYAPEVKIAGAAVGGLVPSISNSLHKVNKGLAAGLIGGGINGLTHSYPELGKVLQDNILAEHKEKFFKPRTQCLGTNLLENTFADYYSMFKDTEIFQKEPATSIMAENAQGKSVPKVPLFVYKSVNDEISPIEDTDKLVKFYCDNGATVEYTRDFLSGHSGLAITAQTYVLPWLRQVMNGEPLAKGCSQSTKISTLLDISTLGLPKVLVDALLGLLGGPVGPPPFLFPL
ncbi:Lipase, secreted [Moelleriella libera RCEF 2490]|uniref:Lipase, secreted n=1 Tax=Moelleriella libera RCEF 2490 TaxID=1081109 RepID=A0A168ANN0_9HYPO|nr:Lipase, secreted [Moelleriella libera RCEF 2490]